MQYRAGNANLFPANGNLSLILWPHQTTALQTDPQNTGYVVQRSSLGQNFRSQSVTEPVGLRLGYPSFLEPGVEKLVAHRADLPTLGVPVPEIAGTESIRSVENPRVSSFWVSRGPMSTPLSIGSSSNAFRSSGGIGSLTTRPFFRVLRPINPSLAAPAPASCVCFPTPLSG